MNIYEKALDNISFNIIIWENVNGKVTCYFSNNRNASVNHGTELSDYLSQMNNDVLKQKYNTFLDKHTDQKFMLNNENIKICSIENNFFYEIRVNANNQKHNILSYVNNNIRNPLTNILGTINILSDKGLSKKYMEHLDIIKQSCYDMIGLSNNIVDIIDLEQNKVKLKFDYVDIEYCIKKCLEIIGDNKKINDIKIVYKIDKSVPKLINIDEHRLIQIIINLLTFSVNNTTEGSVVIIVSLYVDNPDLMCPFDYINPVAPMYNILFQIRDTGSSFNDDEIKCIKYTMGLIDDTIIKSYSNYELGLLINRYLCNLMKGNVWFKTETLLGSTYYFNVICQGKMK